MKFLDNIFPKKPSDSHIYDTIDHLMEWGRITSISWTSTYDVDDEPRSARILLCVSTDNDGDLLESKAVIKAILSGLVMKKDQLDDVFLGHQLGLDTEGTD